MQLLIKRLAVVGGIMAGHPLRKTQFPRFWRGNFEVVRHEPLN